MRSADGPGQRVIELDHIVLRTTDVERALSFYTEVLGLEPVRVGQWRAGEVGFPSVRVNAGTIIDLFAVDSRLDAGNLAHFCLVAEPVHWQQEIDAGLVVKRGPTKPYGARGIGEAVYIEDPNGNTIELRHYGRG
ncbi:VOC family virulence protein [Naumannella sp. ID2617S]|nr:VOC family virulence protein [Naumannella sp. ID2617S]